MHSARSRLARPLAQAVVLIMVAIGLAACADVDKSEPTLTSLDIQAIQKRDYEVTSRIAFASVLSVFQDLGYIIDDADRETGFITAHSPSEDATALIDLLLEDGDVSVTRQTKTTAVIEALTEDRTSIRLNFVVGKTESSQRSSATRDKPILDAETYRNAFDKIEDAIFIRQGA